MTARSWVLHFDLDQFIAAVEVLRRPDLAGVPLIIGGRGDPTERAVVSTASYEARAFGVGSGMPLRLAARKAPTAVILPVDAPAYEAASAEVMETLRRVAAGAGGMVEVLGWDEAFLAVTTDDPEAFARVAQSAVLEATGLHSSLGVGDNKVRAKIATGFGKPRGVFRLTAAEWFDVMGDRPVIDLWGVGTKVSRRLAALGVHTVRELADADEAAVVAEFGPRMGLWYHGLGSGLGPTEVDDSPWIARSHSRETTYQQNLVTAGEIEAAAVVLVDQAFADVQREGRAAVRVTLKVRYAPFSTQTRARKLSAPTLDLEEVRDAARHLVRGLDADREVRLLGIRIEMVMPDEGDPIARTPVRGRI